jgi:hypothetical protein
MKHISQNVYQKMLSILSIVHFTIVNCGRFRPIAPSHFTQFKIFLWMAGRSTKDYIPHFKTIHVHHKLFRCDIGEA